MNKRKKMQNLTIVTLLMSLIMIFNISGATYFTRSISETYITEDTCRNNEHGYDFNGIADYTAYFKQTSTSMTVEKVTITLDQVDADYLWFCVFDLGGAMGTVNGDVSYYDNDGNLIAAWWGNEIISQQILEDESGSVDVDWDVTFSNGNTSPDGITLRVWIEICWEIAGSGPSTECQVMELPGVSAVNGGSGGSGGPWI